MSRHALSSAVSALLLAVAGCDSGGGGGAATSDSAAPQTTAGEWVDDGGLLLAGGGWFDGQQLVVDGAGMVWMTGVGRITRLDPVSGAATSWSMFDDPLFSRVLTIAAAERGVWLLTPERVVRFDGDRFVVDVERPDTTVVEGEPGWTEGAVADGTALWVAGWDGDIARLENGDWSAPIEGRGGPLAIDAEGALWAGDCRWVTQSVRCDVVRFDGEEWVTPGGADAVPRGEVLGLAAAADGGMWVFTNRTLSFFDGSIWTEYAANGLGDVSGPLALTVAVDGAVWVGGSDAVGRLSRGGEWTLFDDAPGPGYRHVVAVGDRVVVTTGDGAFAFTGDGFDRLWRDPSAKPAGWVRGGLMAVSRDEAWVAIDDETNTVWMRFRQGSWSAAGPQNSLLNGASRAVVASDGAVWATTPEGLVRFQGDSWTVMSADATMPLAAGADGAVWAVESGTTVVGLAPDGTRTEIGYPEDPTFPPMSAVRLAVGPDGSVWLASGGYSPFVVARWSDGSWEVVPLPGEVPPMADMALAADGALWALLGSENEMQLGRYDGEWTVVADQPVMGLAAAPGGEVCGAIDGYLVCFDADGETGRVAIGGWTGDVAIAPDGAIWLQLGQIVRMPDGTLEELTS